MKKILSWVIAFAMVITCTLFSYTPANASVAVTHQLKGKTTSEKKYVEGEAIVMFKTEADLSKTQNARVLSVDEGDKVFSGVSAEEVWEFETQSTSRVAKGDTVKVALVKADKMSTSQLVNSLKKKKIVKCASPNYIRHALGNNAKYYSRQWGLKNVNVEDEWTRGHGSSDSVVAIIDTGVNYKHADLKDNMWENTHYPDLMGSCGFDFVNDNGNPMDDHGHGSHCAGVIGGTGNGVSGVNDDVSIMALKFLDEDGSGEDANAVAAYNYINKAIDLGENVVAINNSWGGEGDDEVLDELIDIVGGKGAISVCAAGNDGENNDKYDSYPANTDSPYVISVAALNEDNKLASFSNYGSSVDIAAPGTGILSSVSYNSYLPTLDEDGSLSEYINRFEDASSLEADWSIKKAYISGCDNAEVSLDSEKGFSGSAASAKIKMKLKAGEAVLVSIPYERTNFNEKYPQYFNMMSCVDAPSSNDIFGGSYMLAIDVAADTDVNEDNFEDFECTGYYIDGEPEDWYPYLLECGQDDEKADSRKLVFFIYPNASGNYSIFIDDMGISKSIDSKNFGQYDYMSGTSMATPHVTGAVAIKASQETGHYDADDMINKVVSSSRDFADASKIGGGTLDFSVVVPQNKMRPRISKITVNTDKDTITLKGGGLCPENPADLSVKITDEQDNTTTVTDFIEQPENGKTLVFKDTGNWINTVVDIEVTGAGGKKASKDDVYLVNGKTPYTSIDNLEELYHVGAMAADENTIYMAQSADDAVYSMDVTDSDGTFETVAEINPEELFEDNSSDYVSTDLRFGEDLAYVDGMLYNVVQFAEVTGTGAYDDEWDDWSIDEDEDEDDDYYETDITGSVISAQYKLIAINPYTGDVTDCADIPESLYRTSDWTMAAYNGELYFIGGYSYPDKSITRNVMVYNTFDDEWYEGTPLPPGKARAAGQAMQAGDCLVYTMGCEPDQKDVDIDEQQCPANLIFDGEKWKESKKTIKPYYYDYSKAFGKDEYAVFGASLGISPVGLLYAGTPVSGLGDTFTYDVESDTFAPTDYVHIYNTDGDGSFSGVTVNNAFYGYDQDNKMYRIPVGDGTVYISAEKCKHGKIKGDGEYKQGEEVTLTAVPASGYYTKSFTCDGVSAKKNELTFTAEANAVVTAEFEKYKIQTENKKATIGLDETYQIEAYTTPKEALKKINLTYKVNKPKYATVSDSGVVTPLAKGKGKTVTVTVKADGTKKPYAKVKIKIRKK